MTPFLWEAASRPAYLFDDIAHPELICFTTYACNTHKIHTKSKIMEGGMRLKCTQPWARIRKHKRHFTCIPIPPNRSIRYSYSLGKNRKTCLKVSNFRFSQPDMNTLVLWSLDSRDQVEKVQRILNELLTVFAFNSI